MGKASSNKKVSRAASTGGGRTSLGKRPYGWYGLLMVLAAIGVFLVAFSRNEQQAAANIHPRGSDHWHDAYGIDICGTFVPNLAQNSNLNATPGPGLHTHGDGLIHIEPYFSGLSADAGNNATLARFAQLYPGFKLTSTEIQVPGGKLYKNGDKCGDKPAQIRIRMWSKASASASITYVNPADVHLNDGGAITIAFLPTSADIPKPPQANISALSNPNAGEAQSSAPSAPASPVTAVPVAPSTSSGSPSSSTP